MAADADDPLQTVPIEQFVQDKRAVLEHGGIYGMPSTWVGNMENIPAGFVRLSVHLGITILVLLAAAGLLAQLFRRRDLALTGLLLGMVLYVAAVDRGLLAYDMSRLADPQEPLQVRLVACSRAGATFFYKDTAAQLLGSALSQLPTGTPSSLSNAVGDAAASLRYELEGRAGRS